MRITAISSLLLVAVCGWALDSSAPAATEAAADVQQLNARIAALEQRLAKLEHPTVAAGAITIPAGSYAAAKIVSGVELENGKSAQVMLQVDVSFVAPGGKQVVVKDVRLMGVATADISTRRVTVELNQASLIRADHSLALAQAKGWVVDATDGMTGPAGHFEVMSEDVRAAIASAPPAYAEKLLAASSPTLSIPAGMAVTVVLAQPVAL